MLYVLCLIQFIQITNPQLNLKERTRARTYSESSDGGDVFKLDGETSSCSPATGTSYDVDGKFSYTKVYHCYCYCIGP